MNIRCDRHFQVAADGRKDFAALAHANSAKRAYRSPVGFIVGSFKNKIDIFRRADFHDPFCHAPDELLRFDRAWTENERRTRPANGDFADAQWLCFHTY